MTVKRASRIAQEERREAGPEVGRPAVLMDNRFREIRTAATALGWDTDFRQLDPGRLQADFFAMGGPQLQVLKFRFNRGFHQRGAAPTDMFTFAVTSKPTPHIGFCGTDAPAGALLNFNLAAQFDAITPAYEGVTLSFPRGSLLSIAERLGMREVFLRNLKIFATWDSPTTRRMRDYLERLVRGVRFQGMAVLGELSDSFESGLAEDVVRIVSADESSDVRLSQAQRHRALQSCLEILNDPEQLPVTVSSLCDQTGCSTATLRRLFHSEFGISPKAYIRNRCLSAVRDDLVANSGEKPIVDVANRWGFWHMGQFARDFQRVFDELPSQMASR